MDVVFFLTLLALVSLAIDRLARWAEGRGWIYYRIKKRGGTLGALMAALDPIYHPSSHHAAAELRRIEDERDDDAEGGPPDAAKER